MLEDFAGREGILAQCGSGWNPGEEEPWSQSWRSRPMPGPCVGQCHWGGGVPGVGLSGEGPGQLELVVVKAEVVQGEGRGEPGIAWA